MGNIAMFAATNKTRDLESLEADEPTFDEAAVEEARKQLELLMTSRPATLPQINLLGGLFALHEASPRHAAPELALLSPSSSEQATTRGTVTRDLESLADDGGCSAGHVSSAQWTSVRVGDPLLFSMVPKRAGYMCAAACAMARACLLPRSFVLHGGRRYLLHVNEKGKLKVVFPNGRDGSNETAAGSVLRVPSKFDEGSRYLKFTGNHLQCDSVPTARTQGRREMGRLPESRCV